MRILSIIFFVLTFSNFTFAIEKTEINNFVQDWYSGFDSHQPVEFFNSKFDETFTVQFPGREAITTHAQFQIWFNEVNPLQDVKHDVLSVNILESRKDYAKIEVRVDWSARSGEQKLFFPAFQTWEIKKSNNAIKISTYYVVEAKETSK